MADPWDDWETAADAGLDPKPAKKVDEHEKNKQIWQDANTYVQPEIIRTDTSRTEYVPQVRILRRPREPGSTTITHPSLLPSSSDDADSMPKTFEEREADYNAARQKIFGKNQQEKMISGSGIAIDPDSTIASAAKRGDKVEDSKTREKKKLFDPGTMSSIKRVDDNTHQSPSIMNVSKEEDRSKSHDLPLFFVFKSKSMEGHASSIKRRIGSGSKRGSKILSGGGSSLVTDEVVYAYALRVAYLAHLSQPVLPPVMAPVSSESQNKRFSTVSLAGLGGGLNQHKASVHEQIDNIGSTISSGFSQIHELFKDEKKSSKSQKIPKELIKTLQARLKLIVSGRDPNPIYQDRYLRTDLTLFYNALLQPGFRQQFKSANSKIEDLVLIYLKTAQGELKKATLPPPTTWQDKLTEHVSIFVGILKECLQSKECSGSYSPELIARLDAYQTRFSGSPAAAKAAPSKNGISNNIEDMTMVKTVQAIFNVPSTQVQKDINKLKSQCTLQAAIDDLRTCINHVNRGSPFPARREDFDSDEAYNNWKSQELKTMADIMTALIAFNPGLAPKQSHEVVSTLLSKGRSAAPTSSPAASRSISYSGETEVSVDAYRQFEITKTQEQRTSSARHSVAQSTFNQQQPFVTQQGQQPATTQGQGQTPQQGQFVSQTSNVRHSAPQGTFNHQPATLQGQGQPPQQDVQASPQGQYALPLQQTPYGQYNQIPSYPPTQQSQYPPTQLSATGNYPSPNINYPPPPTYTGAPYQQHTTPAQSSPYQSAQPGFYPPPNFNYPSPQQYPQTQPYTPSASNLYSSLPTPVNFVSHSQISQYPISGATTSPGQSPQQSAQQLQKTATGSSSPGQYPSPSLSQTSPRQSVTQPIQANQYPPTSGQYPQYSQTSPRQSVIQPIQTNQSSTSGQYPQYSQTSPRQSVIQPTQTNQSSTSGQYPQYSQTSPRQSVIQPIQANQSPTSGQYPQYSQSSQYQIPPASNQSRQYPSGQNPPVQSSQFSSVPSPIEDSSRTPASPTTTSGSIGSEKSSESSNIYGAFTYIPPNPRTYYKLLLNKCLDYELNNRAKDDFSLKIFTKNTNDLLNDCVLRWRVPNGYRALLYLDALRVRYDDNHELITLEHIRDGMHALKEAIKKRDLSIWTLSDAKLLKVYEGIHDSLLRFLWEALQHLYKIKTSTFDPVLFLLNDIYESELFNKAHPDVSLSYESIREGVRKVAVTEFQKKQEELASQQEDNELAVLIQMAQFIQAQIEKLSKKYPTPLMGQINVVGLVIEKQVPLFTLDMENLAADILNRVKAGDENGIPVTDIFELYREILNIKVLHETHASGTKFNFSIEEWFRPHVLKWLEMTDNKTPEWVHSAISVDEFKPISSTDRNSSSVVDLFTSFNQTIEFLKRLNWPNEYQFARFMTSLSRTICKALEQYCTKMEVLFRADMFPEEERAQETQKQSAWYVRAKTAIASDEKIIPFDFKPELCIKLNNLEAAREQLDKLYYSIDVDYLSEVIRDAGPVVPEKVEKNRYLFTIKIVLAENIAALDANGYSDPYCVLTDEVGKTLAKTRVIYETLNPRWEEAFDITIETGGDQMRWVAATVWDRDQVGSDDVCGRAYFRLDPQYFNDYLAHDVWLDLEKQGRLLLRISMEGEKDDIQFYFGKAFRTLKRTQSDMARSIVDRMSPFLRQCLSKDVIHKLTKSSSGLSGFFSDKKKEPLTDVEVEEAIYPLFDYFDTNLQTLHTNLTETVVNMVIIKIWKEIEVTLEELLVPPLSDRPSDMKALNEVEADVVFKWLKFLKQYLQGDNDGGVPKDLLENQKYHELMSIAYFYDWDTEQLMQEYLSIVIKNSLTPSNKNAAQNKSVMNQRSLGTIKKRKNEKRKQPQLQENGEIILRILRMRSGTKSFLKQQFEERIRRMHSSTTSEPTVDETAEGAVKQDGDQQQAS
ncbi:13450_t:CDS:10 [Ambispora leptoticha]|uniref:13450_t:CDS:1 n=1 Tax=Ambispora leptoticha TaxID=144679 RepID=A0A9N9F615_9GLOM|nr:13450_t:CDS:10 [Ambispora leptoticha]